MLLDLSRKSNCRWLKRNRFLPLKQNYRFRLSLKKNRTADSELTRSFEDVNHEVSLRYLALLDAVSSIERFRPISVPVDIAYGARTFAAVRQSVTMWCAMWPQARAHVVAGAGHLPIEEAPVEIARIAFEPAGAARG